MTISAPVARPASASRLVSPELVLIDPQLAADERGRLPDPPPPHARAPRTPPPEQRAFRALASAALHAHDSAAIERERRRRNWPRLVVVAAASALMLLLLDVRVDVGRTPAAAETAESSPVTVEPPAQAHRPLAAPVQGGPTRGSASSGRDREPSGETVSARRFVWAPVAGAESYHVELFRGDRRVFAARAKHAELALPAHWRLQGKRYSLSPGDYRWYVWPISSGRRAQTAVVQATLVVR